MAAPSSFSEHTKQALVIRRAIPADAEACGKIVFEAFQRLAPVIIFLQIFLRTRFPLASFR